MASKCLKNVEVSKVSKYSIKMFALSKVTFGDYTSELLTPRLGRRPDSPEVVINSNTTRAEHISLND